MRAPAVVVARLVGGSVPPGRSRASGKTPLPRVPVASLAANLFASAPGWTGSEAFVFGGARMCPPSPRPHRLASTPEDAAIEALASSMETNAIVRVRAASGAEAGKKPISTAPVLARRRRGLMV